MPKPVKKATKKSATPKRASSDPNLRTKQMMSELAAKAATGQPPWAKSKAVPFDEYTATLTVKDGKMTIGEITKVISAHMSKLGAKGGKVSGAKRMKMPKSERKRIASLGAKALWAKRKTGQSANGRPED